MKVKKMKRFKALTSIIILLVLLLPWTLASALAADTSDDYLSANGRTLYDEAGSPVRLTGIAWFGFETQNQVYHGLWSAKMEDVLDTVANQGFNLLRIPLCVQLVNQWRNGDGGTPNSVNYSANPGLEGMTSLQILDASIAYCKQIGLKVMLDMHRVVNTQMLDAWYADGYPPGDFEACWQWLARRYANDDTVIAMDLFNEPHGAPGDVNMVKWDDSTDPNNWKHEAEKVANLVLDVNPELLIVIEGIEVTPKTGYTYAETNSANYDFNWWGGNLRRVRDYPIDLGVRQSQVVYSPHDYGPSVYAQPWFYSGFTKATLTADCWQPNWLYIAMQDLAPILVGEWGGKMDGGDNQKWMGALADTIAQYKLNHTFWCVNPNSGDTGGILLDDWQSVDTAKYNLVEPTLWKDSDGKFVGLDHQVNLGAKGTHVGAATIPDDGGNDVPVTGIVVSPAQLAINGAATGQLTATVSPADATHPAVTWHSSDTAVATVSASGLVSAVANGTATIAATTQERGFTATSAVTVTGIDDSTHASCDSPTAASLPLTIDGAGEFCRVTSGDIRYINSWNMQLVEINGQAYTNTWSNQMPARIDGNYIIHYVGQYAWSHLEVNGSGGGSDNGDSGDNGGNPDDGSGGDASATCDSPTAAALPLAMDGAGEFCRVTTGDIGNINSWNMQLVEINGQTLTNTWSNQMPERIDGKYYIHYVGQYPWSHLEVNGSGGSSSDDGGESQSVAVTGVTVAPARVSIDAGASRTLTATVSPANATNKNVTWTSSDPGVATVDAAGGVTGVAAGGATITVITADGGFTASGDVTVSEDDGGLPDDDSGLPDECSGQCNAATPVYPTLLDDGGLGNVTMYTTAPSDGGACNYGTTDVMSFAAMSVSVLPGDAQGQWQGGKICGQCVEVTALTSQGPKSVVVRIMDKCPDANCGIDLGGAAPAAIMLDGFGRYTGKWRFVPCDGHPEVSDGPPTLDVLQGSNAWWARVHVRNAPTATDTIEWQAADGTAHGFLPYATNPENAFEVPVDDVLQSGMASVLIMVHYVDGTTATVTVTPAQLAAELTSYPLGNSGTDPEPEPTPDPEPTPTAHADNPFAGADGYINSDYATKVLAEAQSTGGTLGAGMAKVADYSTAVWLDRIAAINGSADAMGLRAHLDAALQQQNGATPLTILLVIYDLPNRDCAAAASNGELLIAEDGLNIYKTQYIDPIVAILSDPKYSSLRIVTVVEPDSLPNLVTNLDIAACAEADSSGAYMDGVRYAIDRLHPIDNVYIYLDIAHSGWLGWDSNFSPAVQLYMRMLRGTAAGVNSIDGFITNTANYTPVEEIYLPNADLNVGGQPLKAANFYEWNPYFDEKDFATAMHTAFINAGMPADIGMLIDTSRSGWGGAGRPESVSSATDLNTYVDESRADRRPHRGDWCNQQGAGIGARPQAAPAAGIDAYVWVKPPGESDGVSSAGIVDPDDPNKKFDVMCDPNAQSRYNSAYPTNAMVGAPHAGSWFAVQFRMLVENAEPPLVDDNPSASTTDDQTDLITGDALVPQFGTPMFDLIVQPGQDRVESSIFLSVRG
jgi:cellulase/cellobiase CelA1/aryl-phospho-beta-D-glucosidase BglC (GH1 family)